ncbi:hypothetical protein J2X73_002505 [Novosphingobium sp. 1748]|uniref:hypothetical protein n=1 Tax=Novosphingobium sp. 1748 TaxID=2817760 RepID=UPI002855002B|nr:hypothetical protein [Novosphingobium sp. 1748]MDR6708134.1 hypothetical protein [Novosphingobium sp. 1748]
MSRDLNLRLMRRREITRQLRRAEASKKAMAAYLQGFRKSIEVSEIMALSDVGFVYPPVDAVQNIINRRQSRMASMVVRAQETAWQMIRHLLASFGHVLPIRGARYSGVYAQPKSEQAQPVDGSKATAHAASIDLKPPEAAFASSLTSPHEIAELLERVPGGNDVSPPRHPRRCSCGAVPPCPPDREVRATTASQSGSASNRDQSSSYFLGSKHRYRFVLCGNSVRANLRADDMKPNADRIAPHRLSESKK